MISSVALKALPRAGILVGFGWLSGLSPGSPALLPSPGLSQDFEGLPAAGSSRGAIPQLPPKATGKRDKLKTPSSSTPGGW